ncbi:RNA polymerase III subunit C11 [Salpingoeca rosetta]|uniref:DNA-directed RNA polymerase subunit n=1 Tax=Salpingoeca rosetta (strain ATCC 50818 / BSB-021) TaxID=946362 RepID=F2U3L2_SALR5|nr:RNA polymerase III subunit C11 [Salpingoeca rosetta]EGD82206.1 RNA polymerase III subunit C11 [Salpingoeca rosetta]|eukprot:XP_004996389.1 RNA polymerase III subunit C11 [Salpingoeca rosetta]
MFFMFCPLCTNQLVLDTSAECGTHFACRTCPYKHEMNMPVVSSRKSRNPKQVEDIIGSSTEGLSMTDARCPQCDHARAFFFEMQTRSADEPMTVFYCCEECKHKWSEN